MRDFNFNDAANTDTTDFGSIRPLETPPEAVILQETPHEKETPREDTSSLRFSHTDLDEEEASNLPKIIGAVVVGLLIVGGGIYAYETSFTNRAPVKTVAMRTTAAPTTLAAVPPPSTPDASATPEPTARVKSAAAGAAPKTEPVEQSASLAPLDAPGVGIGPTNDPAINAPMTLTPETAPAPQDAPRQTADANPPAQTTMQQPITAPDVGNTSQPTASIAANQTNGITSPSTSSDPAAQVAPEATEQVTQQPAQIQPAQIQPAQIEPSQVAPQ